MKKLLFVLLIGISTARAQQATEQKIMIGKTEMPGFVATSEHSASEVQEAIAADLTAAGVTKIKKKKNVYSFSGIVLPQVNSGKIDLHYKVVKKKHRSVIYFVVSRGYDNYVTSATDPVITANIIKYLSGIDAGIERNEQIKAKEQEVEQMNEKLQKEQEDVKKAEEAKKQKEKEMEDLKNKK